MEKFEPPITKEKIVAKIDEIVAFLNRRVKEKRLKGDFDKKFEYFWKRFKGRWNEDKGSYVKKGKRLAWAEWQKLTLEEKRKAAAVADRVGGKYTQDAFRWLRDGKFDDFDVVVTKAGVTGKAEKNGNM